MNTKIAIILSMALCSSGCSQRIANFIELSEAMFDAPESVLLSIEEVNSLNYAAQYLQLEGQHRLLAPLTHVSGSQLSWRVGSHHFITMQNGRLVSSEALTDMPLQTSALEDDPLRCLRVSPMNSQQCPRDWVRQITLQEAAHDQVRYQSVWIRSQIERSAAPESLTLLNGKTMQVYRIIERGTWLPAQENGQTYPFENIYWQHVQSLRVVKSQQFLSPSLGYLHSEEVMPYVGELSSQSSRL